MLLTDNFAEHQHRLVLVAIQYFALENGIFELITHRMIPGRSADEGACALRVRDLEAASFQQKVGAEYMTIS